MQKAQVDVRPAMDTTPDIVVHEDGTVRSAGIKLGAREGADDDASTRAVVSPAPSKGDALDAAALPTIRISTDSDHEREQEERRASAALAAAADHDTEPDSDTDGASESDVGEEAGQTLERPVQAAAGAENGHEKDGPRTPGPGQDSFSFSTKRLCERWLDNLFMVLYEVRLSPSCQAAMVS